MMTRIHSLIVVATVFTALACSSNDSDNKTGQTSSALSVNQCCVNGTSYSCTNPTDCLGGFDLAGCFSSCGTDFTCQQSCGTKAQAVAGKVGPTCTPVADPNGTCTGSSNSSGGGSSFDAGIPPIPTIPTTPTPPATPPPPTTPPTTPSIPSTPNVASGIPCCAGGQGYTCAVATDCGASFDIGGCISKCGTDVNCIEACGASAQAAAGQPGPSCQKDTSITCQ